MPKAAIAIGICFILFGTPLIEAIGNTEENSNIISINYSFDEPVIKKVVVGKNEYDMIDMNGLSYGSNPGEPCLPAKGAYILLPQKTKVGKIIATPSEKVFLGSGYKIMPMGNSVPLSDTPQPPIPNKKIYNSKNPFPGKLFTKVGIYNFRGYEILVLMLHPVQYIPATGEIFYYKHITISVKTKEDNYINPLFRGLEKDKMEVIKKVDNPSVADTYTKKMRKSSLEEYDLLIITTDSLKGAFEDLKNYHDDHDIRTVIKTLTETGSSPEEIRDYIRNAYLNWNIDYVLLGGDDDVVPAKMLWVEGLDENVEPYSTFMPSDLYYACLDGTFNYDGDDKWGEPTDGDNGSDVDLIAEVYVGRAPVGNAKEADNFVSKTIEYIEMGVDDYFKKVCLVGEYLGNYGIASYGGNYLDQLIDGSDADGYTTVGIPSDEYEIYTLYDRDTSWHPSDIINCINNGVHFINHLGHSNWGRNMKINCDDVESLTNTKYCFIYSQGCYAGAFDYDDCIAEYHTVKTRHSAFAVIMNARYGFFWTFSTDGDSQRYHREFWDAIFGEGILRIGKANQDSKEDNLYIIERSMMRWCYYQLNLLGDPAVALRISNPPDKPSRPNGETVVKVGKTYIYTTTVVDPDGDQIYYKWDWGDGNISDWIGPYTSGEVINESHAWEKKGVYGVRVKAKDTHGLESEWSEPLTISVPYNSESREKHIQYLKVDSRIYKNRMFTKYFYLARKIYRLSYYHNLLLSSLIKN
ncbi:MAG: hypothetical protein DRO67_06670 [Candidatus Asgardarchaeum californiense]|nr:MAG: hypothetical protein DRO67_06670 [Candidatus Asgardarchaeum californiense]